MHFWCWEDTAAATVCQERQPAARNRSGDRSYEFRPEAGIASAQLEVNSFRRGGEPRLSGHPFGRRRWRIC